MLLEEKKGASQCSKKCILSLGTRPKSTNHPSIANSSFKVGAGGAEVTDLRVIDVGRARATDKVQKEGGVLSAEREGTGGAGAEEEEQREKRAESEGEGAGKERGRGGGVGEEKR